MALFIILLSTFFMVDTQSVIFKEIIPVTNFKRFPEKNSESIPNKALKINSEYTQNDQHTPENLNVDYKAIKNDKSSSTKPHKQLNVNLFTKMPLKIPLVTKTIQTLSENVLMKANPSAQTDANSLNDSQSLKNVPAENEANPIVMETLKDVVPTSNMAKPKSNHNVFRKNKEEEIHTPKYKPKTPKFYEDDAKCLLVPKLKEKVTAEPTITLNETDKLKTNDPSSISTNVNKIKAINEKTEIGDDYINIDNGTHCVYIKKIAHNGNDSKIDEAQEKITDTNFYLDATDTVNVKTLDSSLGPKSEDVVIDKHRVSGDNSNKPELILKTKDYSADEFEDKSTGTISITNHNYEEIEENPKIIYPQVTIVDEPTSTLIAYMPDIDLTEAFENYYQNYQAIVQQYLNNIEKNIIALNKENWYNIPNKYANNIQGNYVTYYLPYKTQTTQEYSLKPDYKNYVQSLTEKPKIYRSWQDTEVKINKPNVNNIKSALEYFRNYFPQKYYGNALVPYIVTVIDCNG